MSKKTEYSCKPYEVRITFEYQRVEIVHASSPEKAIEKMKMVVCDTDLIQFKDEDDLMECKVTIDGEDDIKTYPDDPNFVKEWCEECIFDYPNCDRCLCDEGE